MTCYVRFLLILKLKKRYLAVQDVNLAVQDFFLKGKFLTNLNSNLIVLIPKVPGADNMGEFRPIALANFQFKIITKTLADRLASVPPRVISTQQCGFIHGRQISDCVLVASEAINVLQKKCFAGNLALKIDIRKAFDTLEWSFLISVLQQFGFSPIFCAWIEEILRSARLSILVNGKAVGFFNCLRGRGFDSYVLYADDIMIFCKASKVNIKCILPIFKQYGKASDQLINQAKSKYYGGTISSVRLSVIANLLGFSAGQIPFTYLGCPIFQGKPRAIYFQAIVDRIKVKLASCKGGLGLRSVRRINESLILKLSWTLLASDEQWVVLCRSRFLRHHLPISYAVKSSIWSGLKRYIQVVFSNSRWLIEDELRVFYWTDDWLGGTLPN
ncbi:ribonuclease H [Trifolium pratense]|uniref:Ribonuclease H n=1 Tax=Trifolium pratense TaxID=57577 RepID=A0A2K3NN96_TRIPR|nr:ribonuclease H [Trifolium pratense]